jgi:uncharacterized protein YggE
MGRMISRIHGKHLVVVAVCVAAVALGASGALLAGCSGGEAEGSGSPAVLSGAGVANTITVSGNAVVTSAPDEAVVVLTVQNDAPTATAAMDTTSNQSNQVLVKLKGLGIEDAAIQTTGVTLYPVRTYDPTTGKETLAGYRADNTIKVTLKDAPTVAKVFAAAVETGVTQTSGPDWRLRDDSKAVNDALKLAVEHARAKAETLAAASGVTLGEVFTVSESSVQVPVPIYSMTGGAALDSAKVTQPAVSAGTLDVTASVTITYTLKR